MSCRLPESNMWQTPQTTPSCVFFTSVSNRIIYPISQVIKSVTLSISFSFTLTSNKRPCSVDSTVNETPIQTFLFLPIPPGPSPLTHRSFLQMVSLPLAGPYCTILQDATTSLVIFLSCLKTFSGSLFPTGKRSNPIQELHNLVSEYFSWFLSLNPPPILYVLASLRHFYFLQHALFVFFFFIQVLASAFPLLRTLCADPPSSLHLTSSWS